MGIIYPGFPPTVQGTQAVPGVVLVKFIPIRSLADELVNGFVVRASSKDEVVHAGKTYSSAKTLAYFASQIQSPYKQWLGPSASGMRSGHGSKYPELWVSVHCIKWLLESVLKASAPYTPLRPMVPNANMETALVVAMRTADASGCPRQIAKMGLSRAEKILNVLWGNALSLIFRAINDHRERYNNAVAATFEEQALLDDQMLDAEDAFARIMAQRFVTGRPITGSSPNQRLFPEEVPRVTRATYELIQQQEVRVLMKSIREHGVMLDPYHAERGRRVEMNEEQMTKYLHEQVKRRYEELVAKQGRSSQYDEEADEERRNELSRARVLIIGLRQVGTTNPEIREHLKNIYKIDDAIIQEAFRRLDKR